ncbi:MAG: hypothetical protein CL671_04900 [Balneola sp.]|nr:hypothetical protein [Balneola sp.]MBF63926.1 hypothetical protein [Balneola sp.]
MVFFFIGHVLLLNNRHSELVSESYEMAFNLFQFQYSDKDFSDDQIMTLTKILKQVQDDLSSHPEDTSEGSGQLFSAYK